MKKYLYPREWFFILAQLIAAAAFVWALFNSAGIDWAISLFGYFLITCLGITVTFHRLLSHKSYTLSKPLEYLFSYFGNIGCTGSSVGWVFVHREHHKHADQVGDPHSPVILGPVGAFIGNYGGKFNKWSVKEIINNPVHRFMHEYYIAIVLGTFLMLSAVSFSLAIHLMLIPIFLNTMASRLSNWIDHDPRFGTRCAGNSNDQSHNVWWWSVLTFGEGWHHNHHMYPGDWRIGKYWWQFDPGKYTIQSLMYLGLASDRKISYNKLRS
jgi:stearoyl-CoA desaturase (delta-9 desaturase)